MSDAKFIALMTFLGLIVAPFMGLIVQRLGKIVKTTDATHIAVNSERTSALALIESLRAEVRALHDAVSQADKLQAKTEQAAGSDAAPALRKTRPKVK